MNWWFWMVRFPTMRQGVSGVQALRRTIKKGVTFVDSLCYLVKLHEFSLITDLRIEDYWWKSFSFKTIQKKSDPLRLSLTRVCIIFQHSPVRLLHYSSTSITLLLDIGYSRCVAGAVAAVIGSGCCYTPCGVRNHSRRRQRHRFECLSILGGATLASPWHNRTTVDTYENRCRSSGGSCCRYTLPWSIAAASASLGRYQLGRCRLWSLEWYRFWQIFARSNLTYLHVVP